MLHLQAEPADLARSGSADLHHLQIASRSICRTCKIWPGPASLQDLLHLASRSATGLSQISLRMDMRALSEEIKLEQSTLAVLTQNLTSQTTVTGSIILLLTSSPCWMRMKVAVSSLALQLTVKLKSGPDFFSKKAIFKVWSIWVAGSLWKMRRRKGTLKKGTIWRCNRLALTLH